MRIGLLACLLLGSPAFAQSVGSAQHSIDVTGHGKVSVPPDTANLHYWLRGEGKTADDATRAMVDSQTRVETGLKGFLGPEARITNSNLVVIEVRDPNCKVDRGQPMLSQGECSIVGYLATSEADVRTPNISKAGTAIGLASRLGARDARLQSYELRDSGTARQEAMTRAVSDARNQAQTLAGAAGSHLGRALNIRFGSYGELFVSGSRIPVAAAPPPPPPPPPPVEIEMTPQPQDITADVSISFELLP